MSADVYEGERPEARLAAYVLAAGLGFGVLADGLFYRSEVGLNAALWIGTLAIAGWLTYGRAGRPAGALPMLLGAVGFLAVCLAWRTSPFLRLWDTVAIAAAASREPNTSTTGTASTAPVAMAGTRRRASPAWDHGTSPRRRTGPAATSPATSSAPRP